MEMIGWVYVFMTALLVWNWIGQGSVVLDSGSRGFFCTLIDC
jgi:hypothetical protein